MPRPSGPSTSFGRSPAASRGASSSSSSRRRNCPSSSCAASLPSCHQETRLGQQGQRRRPGMPKTCSSSPPMARKPPTSARSPLPTSTRNPGDLPTLHVLGWDGGDTPLKLDHVDRVLQRTPALAGEPESDHGSLARPMGRPFRHRIGHVIQHRRLWPKHWQRWPAASATTPSSCWPPNPTTGSLTQALQSLSDRADPRPDARRALPTPTRRPSPTACSPPPSPGPR